MEVVNKIALALTIIGALVWGIYGIFEFNLVSWLFHDSLEFIARIIYTLVGIAGIWCISLLFRQTAEDHEDREAFRSGNTGVI